MEFEVIFRLALNILDYLNSMLPNPFFRYLINMISTRRNQQFFTYCFFAGISAIVDLSIVFILTDLLGIYYVISILISYPVALTTNFVLNKHLNFKNKSRKYFSQISIFIIVNLLSLALSLLITYILTEFLLIWYLLSRVISLLITAFFSFAMHRLYTFRT